MSIARRSLMNTKGSKEIPNYLCFTALEDGTFSFRYITAVDKSGSYIEYSIDECKSWVRTKSIDKQEQIITTPTIRAGEKVYWRGRNYRHGFDGGYFNFLSTCSFDVSGHCVSILRGDDFSNVIQNSIKKLFINCKVVNAADLILPKFEYPTSSSCFAQMFSGCSSLVSAPNFHNDRLTSSCYSGMFKNCTSLITVPFVLDCTTLVSACYSEMFSGCTSLTTSPLKGGSYSVPTEAFAGMFTKCTNLVNVEDLYIIELQRGYRHLGDMFWKCTQLVHSPIKSFPKQVWRNCYYGLFDGCTNLIDCPELPAETEATGCYYHMLKNTKITWIKMLAISAKDCLKDWVANVPNVNTGVFVKHINAQWTNTGNSGVPTNWTIIYYDPTEDKYYTDQTKATECDDHGNPI